MPYFDSNLRVGSEFGPLRTQKRSKSNKPQNPDLTGLIMATKSFQVINVQMFVQILHSGGDFGQV